MVKVRLIVTRLVLLRCNLISRFKQKLTDFIPSRLFIDYNEQVKAFAETSIPVFARLKCG